MSNDESFYNTTIGSEQLETWQSGVANFLVGTDPERPQLTGSAASSILQPTFHTYIDNVERDLGESGQLGVVVTSMMEALAENMKTADRQGEQAAS